MIKQKIKIEDLEEMAFEKNTIKKQKLDRNDKTISFIILSLFFLLSILVVMGLVVKQTIEHKDFIAENNQKINKQVLIANNKEIEIHSVILEDWASRNYLYLSDKEKEVILANPMYQFLFSEFSTTSEGFTSNPSKKFNSTGSLNLKYVEKTREDLQLELAILLNRIVNPTFGDWTDYQKNKNLNKLSNTFYDITLDFTGLEILFNFNDMAENNIYYGFIKDFSVNKIDDIYNIVVDVDYKVNEDVIKESRKIVLDLKIDSNKLKIVKGVIQNEE